ncbi:MAG: alkaline phosphatase family protein [Candidatus Rokubacteria bacterium]|nr:alkaline phosphatase family protein [Candidatus Rokubacteria bacterium]
MKAPMPLDDLVLALQRLLDRLVRRAQLGPAPAPGRRRLLIGQIDGLSRAVLDEARARGSAPFLARLVGQRGWRLAPLAVGLPSSTPTFQMAAMYGVRPDIPGFHYHDKRRRDDVYFPRGGDAAWVEATQAAGRPGVLRHGGAYGCVFTGGATDNLLTFTMMKRPTGGGALRALSRVVVLAWVALKSSALSAIELARAVLRLLADPVGETERGWRWLAIKIGISVWLRELFTMVVARDLYAGVPAVWVNYLDYDVFAHAYGPRHRRAHRALRRIDRSIHQLWRVLRRVPEHRYDLYVLSDHGQAACTPYLRLSGGRPIEEALFDFFEPPRSRARAAPAGRARRLARGIAAFRTRRAPGLFQRFVNYLEQDFALVLGGLRSVREHDGIRVVAAGPNAFVYFLERPEPLGAEWIDARFPDAVDEISRSPGVGFVLVRAAAGPLCVWRGTRYRLDDLQAGPFAGRPDLGVVADGLRDLMAMPSAGDLVVYGIGAPEGHVSYVPEVGTHAGASYDELHTFLIHPRGADVPPAVAHPIELYPVFLRYQGAA